MKSTITVDSSSNCVTIRIKSKPGEIHEILVQKTNRTMKLEDRCYERYKIISPKGYEDQEIFHCPDRGLEVLLSLVFMTLAERTKRFPGCDVRS